MEVSHGVGVRRKLRGLEYMNCRQEAWFILVHGPPALGVTQNNKNNYILYRAIL